MAHKPVAPVGYRMNLSATDYFFAASFIFL